MNHKCEGLMCFHKSHFEDGGEVKPKNYPIRDLDPQKAKDAMRGLDEGQTLSKGLDNAKKEISSWFGSDKEQSAGYAKGGRVATRPGGREATDESHGPTGPTKYKNRNKSSDMSGGQRRGPEGYPKYQEQAQNEKGIHTPVSGVTGFPGAKGESKAGSLAKETWGGKPHRELRDMGKEKHREKLAEMKAMPAPNIRGLAEGGEVDSDGDHDGDMDTDNELMDMCADECMEALKKGDKKGFIDAIKAIVMSCKE